MKNDEKPISDSPHGRRDFFKRMATATAAVAGAGLIPGGMSSAKAAPAATTAANSRLGIGVVGLGSQGRSHIRQILSHKDDLNLELRGICELFEKRRNVVQADIDFPSDKTYTDYRRMLEDDGVDAVIVATVDHWHTRIAIEAMEAGKDVYIEKPATRYLGEMFDVYDVAKKTGKTLQGGSQFCTYRQWHKAAELIREGKIGPVVHAQASYTRNSGPEGEWNYRIDPDLTPETIDWREWLGPVSDRPFSADDYFRWRKYYPYCSGILGDLLPHNLGPMMVALAGEGYPRRVSCQGTREITTDRDVADDIQVLVEFDSGASLSVFGSTVNEQGISDMIRGHHATLHIGGGRVSLNPERPFADEIDPATFDNLTHPQALRAHQRDWIECIRNGREPAANPDNALKVQIIIALAEMSDRLGVVCRYDGESRKITTGDGRPLEPITYGTLEPG